MKSFLFFFLLFNFKLSLAQTITVQVQPEVVRPGDRFLLTVTVSSEASVNIEEPELPNLTAFRLLNASTSSETRSVFNNGQFQVSRAQSFNYEVEALQPGRFTIAPIRVVVNGEPKVAPDVTIQVGANAPPSSSSQYQDEESDSFQQMDDMFQQLLQRRLDQLQGRPAQPPGSGGSRRGGVTSPADLKDAFYIEVEVDKTQVYVGEQVTVSWYLVTRAQVSDIDTLKYPAVSGFWREDLELATRLNFRPEMINGVNYNRALLASFALFPLKAGVSKIDEYTARCTLVSMGLFGVNGQETVTQSSQAVPITVLPLPEQNKPESFSGAVGEFKVTARVEKTSVEANVPLTYKVRFEGRGNAKPIDWPKIVWPEGIEYYDSKSSSKYFADGRSYKEFEVILVPRKEGAVTLPAIDFSFFSPTRKTYYVESTTPILLTVLPGATTSTFASQPLAEADKVAAPAQPMLPPLALQMKGAQLFSLQAKMLTWSFVLLFGLIFVGYRARIEFSASEKKENLKKIMKDKLSVVDRLVSHKEYRSAAVELTNLVYLVMGELSGSGGASREISILLEKSPPSFRRDLAAEYEKNMSRLEAIAFAPAELSGANPAQVIQDVKNLLKRSLEYNFDDNEMGSN